MGFGWKIFIFLYINEMWKLQFDLLRLGTLFFERNTCQVLRLKKMSPLFFTSNEWFHGGCVRARPVFFPPHQEMADKKVFGFKLIRYICGLSLNP